MKFHILGSKNGRFLADFESNNPLPPPLTQKNFQILFHFLIANKISGILTEGIVKISINKIFTSKKRR